MRIKGREPTPELLREHNAGGYVLDAAGKLWAIAADFDAAEVLAFTGNTLGIQKAPMPLTAHPFEDEGRSV